MGGGQIFGMEGGGGKQGRDTLGTQRSVGSLCPRTEGFAASPP